MDSELTKVTRIIKRSDALLVAAGAGMGVDSGLPDYRGKNGFWNAYPPYKELNLDYADMATPKGFDSDPSLAWGFFGHQLSLYRNVKPHAGFDILHQLGSQMSCGYFVVTTNIDGQFQKAGFPENKVHQCHGSVHRLQCQIPCTREVWSANGTNILIDEKTMLAEKPFPTCPNCGGVARPNVFMFGDTKYVWEESQKNADRFRTWLKENNSRKVVILEIGSGTGAPGLRNHCEEFAINIPNSTFIRINLREPQTPKDQDFSISLGALDALTRINYTSHRQ